MSPEILVGRYDYFWNKPGSRKREGERERVSVCLYLSNIFGIEIHDNYLVEILKGTYCTLLDATESRMLCAVLNVYHRETEALTQVH